MVAYDSTNLYKKLCYKNAIFYKIYTLFLDNYINIFFSQNISLTNMLKPTAWLEREVLEFFFYKFLNMSDTRNIFLDYSLCTPILKKSFILESFSEVKQNIYMDNSLLYSQSVEL